MSIKSANIWSKIGFLFGCALFLALLTADLTTYAESGQASLPFGLHGQVIVFTVMITMGSAFTQIAIWRMRNQLRQQRDNVREIVVEVLNEIARLPEPKPEATAEPTAPLRLAELPPDNVRAFELGRSVERHNGSH